MNGQNGFSKHHGLLEQTQKGFFAVRVRTVAGNLTSDQLRHLAELADKYGNGQLHITTRQSVELHGVKGDRLEDVFRAIDASGLLLAVRGPRVLTAISCPGATLCKQGISDTRALAARLDALMVGREQPGKTKIALSGCPNSCAKPQINDIGLHGVIVPAAVDGCDGCNTCAAVCKVGAITVRDRVPSIAAETCVGCGSCVRSCPRQALVGEKRGYAVYVGGKIGKKSLLGNKVFPFIPEQEAVTYIEAILGAYNRLANKGERIGDVVNRTGLAAFRQEILKSDSQQG